MSGYKWNPEAEKRQNTRDAKATRMARRAANVKTSKPARVHNAATGKTTKTPGGTGREY